MSQIVLSSLDYLKTSKNEVILWLFVMVGTTVFVLLDILPLPWSVLFPLLLWTAITDWKLRIIPNTVPLVLIILGFYLSPLTALGGMFGCFLIWIPFLIINGMGGGDIKMAAAVGATLGYYGGLMVLLYANILAIIYILLLKLIKKEVKSWLKESYFAIRDVIKYRNKMEIPEDEQELIRKTIPLGFFFLPGAILYYLINVIGGYSF